MKSKNYTAQIITEIFDPTVVFFFSLLFVVYLRGSLQDQIAGIIFLALGGLLPLASLVYEYLNTKVNKVVTREERNHVYLAGFFSYSVLSTLFATQIFSDSFWSYLSTSLALYFAISLMINTFIDKTSQHVGMFSFWVMALIEFASPGFGLLFAALPLIMWSRLKLSKHTWVQMFWGMAVGMLTGLLLWL